MGQFSKQEAIRIVVSCAEAYKTELLNRDLLIVSKANNNRLNFLRVTFRKGNFLHLTGLKTKVRAARFFDMCIAHKLSPKVLEFASDGTTQLKLEVLPQLMRKDLSAKMIGDIDSRTPKLYTEKLVGNIRACMGFKNDSSTYVPNTVLNRDMRDITSNRAQIVAVLRKSTEESQYTEVTYKTQLDFSKYLFPKEYEYLREALES